MGRAAKASCVGAGEAGGRGRCGWDDMQLQLRLACAHLSLRAATRFSVPRTLGRILEFRHRLLGAARKGIDSPVGVLGRTGTAGPHTRTTVWRCRGWWWVHTKREAQSAGRGHDARRCTWQSEVAVRLASQLRLVLEAPHQLRPADARLRIRVLSPCAALSLVALSWRTPPRPFMAHTFRVRRSRWSPLHGESPALPPVGGSCPASRRLVCRQNGPSLFRGH